MSPRKDQLVARKYRLREPLASGGMGAVWVARHVELEVDVAIKFRAAPDELDASAVDRFKREAQAAARLKSAHVVHIYDYGVDDGVPYIAMELLDGEDLGELLDREHRLPLGRTAALVAQAAKGLECAHEAGIVHRDIKPRNLFLARQGSDEVLKILDFGIAKRTVKEGDDGTTSANVILGSPSYMSPEQARGLELTATSDVWSLAAVAYRALTGVPPFQGTNSQDTVIRICTERAPPPTRHCPDLPGSLDGLFERALSRDLEQRFESASEFAEALTRIAKEHPRERPPATRKSSGPRGRSTATETLVSPAEEGSPSGRRWPMLGVLAVGLLLAAGLLARHETRPTPPDQPRAREAPKGTASAPRPTTLSAAASAPKPTLEPASLSAAIPPVESQTVPSPPPPRARIEQVRAPAPKTPAQATPPLDPVFGLPVAPQASSKR